MQTPPYGLFPAKAGIKALPQGKSKELNVIPQAAISGQQKQPGNRGLLVFDRGFDL